MYVCMYIYISDNMIGSTQILYLQKLWTQVRDSGIPIPHPSCKALHKSPIQTQITPKNPKRNSQLLVQPLVPNLK